MNAPLRKPWTQEEFFSWAERQEERYEFDGFQPVAVTGSTGGHSRIGGNIFFALRSRLGKGPREVLGPDPSIETTNNAIRYPDALITGTSFDPAVHEIPGGGSVLEVLSPSSDRIVKLREYATVPSIKRSVILESTSAGLQVLEGSSPEQPGKPLP